MLALQALGWLVGNEDLLPVFLGSTGLAPSELAERAADADFLGSVLDFILMDDAWVIGFCDSVGLRYEAPMQARAALPGGRLNIGRDAKGPQRMIDGVIFDKDGTLFDFRRSWGAWATGFLRQIARDKDHAAALGQAIGFDLATGEFAPDSPVIAATAADIAAALAPLLPGQSLAGVEDRINAAATLAVMVPAVPLRPLLDGLRAGGLRLGLATNDTEAPARAHLAAHDLTDLFDFVAGHDSGHGAKPGPGMCLAFARATGLSPGRVVMVGDSLHDLHAGRAAGMICVAVLTGVAPAAVLGPHADAVLPDIGALPGWLAARAG